MPTNTINFTVSVTFPTPTTGDFTIYQNGRVVTGDITVTCAETVVYELTDSPGVIFTQPSVSQDPHNNISAVVSGNGRTLTISDSDQDTETICIKLAVINPDGGATVYSPDPQYRNIPQ